MHYYQPAWTLVGGGIKSVESTQKPMKDVLPKNADWIKSKVVSFDPDQSKLSTSEGDDISYEYLVIAMGMQLRYEDVRRQLSKAVNFDNDDDVFEVNFGKCVNFVNFVNFSQACWFMSILSNLLILWIIR